MSRDLSQEEANLAVATALMREVMALRAENTRLQEENEQLRTFMQTQAAAIRTLHECEKTEINRLRKEQHKWFVANSTLDSEREANAILTDENARLREALQPFAKAGELFTERSMFSDQLVYLPAAGEAYQIVGDDLRRARAALGEAS